MVCCHKHRLLAYLRVQQDLENIDDDIRMGMEFIVYEGEKHGRPSKIVDLTRGAVKVKER